MQGSDIIFGLIILLFSVMLHEVAHGYAALYFGDATAKLQGRLTLNPLKHIDPIGSIGLPILLAISGLPVFGWAKPVPYNPYNLRRQKLAEGVIAVAGVATNIVIALVFGLIFRFGPELGISPAFGSFLVSVVVVNILLAVFNLVPIPPLDGSKILASLLPYRAQGFIRWMEQYSFLGILIAVFLVWQIVSPIVYIASGWILGL